MNYDEIRKRAEEHIKRANFFPSARYGLLETSLRASADDVLAILAKNKLLQEVVDEAIDVVRKDPERCYGGLERTIDALDAHDKTKVNK